MKVTLKDIKLASHRVKVKPTCFHKNVWTNTVIFCIDKVCGITNSQDHWNWLSGEMISQDFATMSTYRNLQLIRNHWYQNLFKKLQLYVFFYHLNFVNLRMKILGAKCMWLCKETSSSCLIWGGRWFGRFPTISLFNPITFLWQDLSLRYPCSWRTFLWKSISYLGH